MLPPSTPRSKGKRTRDGHRRPTTTTLAFVTREVTPGVEFRYWHSLQYTVADSAVWNAVRLGLTAFETARLVEVIRASAVPYLEQAGGRSREETADKENNPPERAVPGTTAGGDSAWEGRNGGRDGVWEGAYGLAQGRGYIVMRTKRTVLVLHDRQLSRVASLPALSNMIAKSQYLAYANECAPKVVAAGPQI